MYDGVPLSPDDGEDAIEPNWGVFTLILTHFPPVAGQFTQSRHIIGNKEQMQLRGR